MFGTVPHHTGRLILSFWNGIKVVSFEKIHGAKTLSNVFNKLAVMMETAGSSSIQTEWAFFKKVGISWQNFSLYCSMSVFQRKDLAKLTSLNRILWVGGRAHAFQMLCVACFVGYFPHLRAIAEGTSRHGVLTQWLVHYDFIPVLHRVMWCQKNAAVDCNKFYRVERWINPWELRSPLKG